MHSATNEVGHTVLPWLVIREDNNGNRYRVGRYATRDEAQRISDSLVARNHQQLYWVEKLTGPGGPPNPTLFRDFTQGARKSRLERLPQETPPPSKTSADAANSEPANGAQDVVDRRLQRGRPLFEALAHILPVDARKRWAEEWTAEWGDLGERPLRTRVAFLMFITLRSLPYIAWTLRFAARRQRAQ